LWRRARDRSWPNWEAQVTLFSVYIGETDPGILYLSSRARPQAEH
jgi:hypothetical protein